MPFPSSPKLVSYFEELPSSSSSALFSLDEEFGLSHQQEKMLVEAARDLIMWQEEPIEHWLELAKTKVSSAAQPKQARDKIVKGTLAQIAELKSTQKSYEGQTFAPPKRSPQKIVVEQSDRNLLGDCPVYSEKLVCCQLKTLDVVQNCSFGCSYCTIQTFYGDKVSFDGKLKEKLLKTEASLDMTQFQHIGTGQSSDSLVWGNRENVLSDLCDFARRNPKVLLEFKTKSANVKHLLELDVPKNVVCSWSLNTTAIVENEEHFTASLDQRIGAARKAADGGIKVAFHFHPIVHYDGWKADYTELVEKVLGTFSTEEVLFVSFGSVTFIKPVIQKLREQGHHSKMLQMEMVPDPHGKLSYPDEVKVEIFEHMYGLFQPWRNKVFQYLCMERAYFWDEVFGWHYPTNDHFASAFAHSTWQKIFKGEQRETFLTSLPHDPILHREN